MTTHEIETICNTVLLVTIIWGVVKFLTSK
jgi:hypothetical protein